MIYRLLILWVLCGSAFGETPQACAQPAWTVDLSTTYGFESFGFGIRGDALHPPGWIESRGVTFISPSFVAVYEVLPTKGRPPALTARGRVADVGTFVLQVQVIAASDGNPVTQLRLPTGPGVNRASAKWEANYLFQSVLPTHNGKFLVRTKGRLLLYSADFKEITSRELPLPLSKEATEDTWGFVLSPSGDRIYAEHVEGLFVKGHPEPPPRAPSPVGYWKDTSYILDADSLQVLHTWDHAQRPSWGQRVWEDPQSSAPPWGREYRVSGKGRITTVLSAAGEQLLTISLAGENYLGSTELTDTLFVAETYRHRADTFDVRRCVAEPVRLAIYDLASKSEKCSIPITEKAGPCGSGFLFSASSAGDVVVIQGTQLSLYRFQAGGPGNPHL